MNDTHWDGKQRMCLSFNFRLDIFKIDFTIKPVFEILLQYIIRGTKSAHPGASKFSAPRVLTHRDLMTPYGITQLAKNTFDQINGVTPEINAELLPAESSRYLSGKCNRNENFIVEEMCLNQKEERLRLWRM